MTDSAQLRRLIVRGDAPLLEAAAAALFDAGAGGIVDEPGAIAVYAQSEEELDSFRNALREMPAGSALEYDVETVDPTWEATWQTALAPEKICPTFVLRPTHCPKKEGDEEDHQTLWFEPQSSFGSGGHPTTRLAASWVEEAVRSHPGCSCLDVGTGTGVLAMVAARLGAGTVVAVDIDEIAVRSAEKNAELNSLSGRLSIEQGSADAREGTFDLVLANINTHILRELAPSLAARVIGGGKLMLTGLLTEDVSELEPLFSAQGLQLSERREEGQWALLSFTHGT